MTAVTMLSNIPTHLIAGPLGAGKTSLIRHLLAHKPAHERWAVLINEFGQIGLDQALLTNAGEGISLSEVPGGCLCCVNGAPFQIGLARLLRKAQPDRLLIEPGRVRIVDFKTSRRPPETAGSTGAATPRTMIWRWMRYQGNTIETSGCASSALPLADV